MTFADIIASAGKIVSSTSTMTTLWTSSGLTVRSTPYSFTRTDTPTGHLFVIDGIDKNLRKTIKEFIFGEMGQGKTSDVETFDRSTTDERMVMNHRIALHVEFDNDAAATTFQLFWDGRKSY